LITAIAVVMSVGAVRRSESRTQTYAQDREPRCDRERAVDDANSFYSSMDNYLLLRDLWTP